jgi:hypothetical protein
MWRSGGVLKEAYERGLKGAYEGWKGWGERERKSLVVDMVWWMWNWHD